MSMPVNNQSSVASLLVRTLDVLNNTAPLTKAEEARVLKESRQLSFRFIREQVELAAEKGMKAMIHGTQQVVTWLLEYIVEKNRISQSHFLARLEANLCDFLLFLKKNTGQWFNNKALMPLALWRPINEQLSPYLYEGHNYAMEHWDNTLVKMIKQSFEASSSPTPNYNTAHYWLQLVACIKDEQYHPLRGNDRNIWLLIRFNFNDPAFIRYVHYGYTQALQTAASATQQWMQNRLLVNNIIQEQGLALYTDAKNCREQLIQLIEVEIEASNYLSTTMQPACATQKLVWKMTTSQLAVWLHAFVQADLIEVETITELIRFMCNNTVTRRSPAINFETLYNNYYNKEMNACKTVHTQMRQMLLHVAGITA